ncbi:hypothetical protein M3690_04175 [Priestia megaterium]|uniref:hypothetical protein n=1 Tax=Priestia megaterium TaxID=1404 RepID=UPI00203E99F8|nr:hypothetical protein [Priestia megaterium]MCM3792488.1 hypothetical protein [Priestia megaterium]
MSIQAEVGVVLSRMSNKQKDDIIESIALAIDHTKQTGYTTQQAFERIIEILEEGGIVEK